MLIETFGKHGVIFEIDDDDYEKIKTYRWHALKHPNGFYIQTTINRKTIRLHRFLMDFPPGMDIDHIDGNTLNNKKCNLRICSRARNCQNSKTCSRNTSGHRGVYWDSSRNKWRVQIQCLNKTERVGRFLNITDAIDAYTKRAKELFGEYYKMEA